MILRLVFGFLIFTFLALPSSQALGLNLEPAQLDTLYTARLQTLQSLEAQLTPKQKRDFAKTRYTRRGKALSKNDGQLKTQYQQALAAWHELKPAFDLREDLLAMHHKAFPQSHVSPALKEEATRLAVELIRITPEFKKKYRSIGIPLVHNTMINVGVRERGACKHWAEDLLNHLIPQNRKFFSLTWGEANPGKVNEHNTFVIYPTGSDFYHGMLYDPWRTSGKPFWIGVKADTHYPWQPWKEYGHF